MTLCPDRQGQSNISHFGIARDPTRTAVFLGSFCGTSSAASTTATMRQDRRGRSHSHHGSLLTRAMFAPGTAA
jgi:hypothetical protein